MNYTEFRTRMRHILWLTSRSDAARNASKWGGNTWIQHNQAVWAQARDVLEIREKDWIAMTGKRKTGFIENIKFVDLELTREGKDAFKVWEFSDDDFISYLERMGVQGYKFGTRYDSANGTWIASLTCAEKSSANYGYCLSARGRSWIHAAQIVAYKDLVLLAGNWAAVNQSEDSDIGWG